VIYSGKDFRLQRFTDGVTPTYHNLGGIVEPCEPVVGGEPITAVGVGVRQLALLKTARSFAQINPTILLQVLDDYITSHAMISGEGSVPEHILRWTDGVENRGLKKAKVSTCELRLVHGDILRADLVVEGLYDATTFTPSWESEYDFDPITHDKLTTFTIGAYDFKDEFKELVWGVDHNLEREYAGPTLEPRGLIEKEAIYRGSFLITKEATDDLLEGARIGTEWDIVISIEDNQPTPVTKTFTFDDVILTDVRLIKRGLGAEYRRVAWQGAKLTIT